MENVGGVGSGGGNDTVEEFQRNEAISAVIDEGFGLEDDDDYEDLYNDVNVGDGFLNSLKKDENLRFENDLNGNGTSQPDPGAQNQPLPPPPPPRPPMSESFPSVVERSVEGNVDVSNGGINVGPRVGTSSMGHGLRVELAKSSIKLDDQAVGIGDSLPAVVQAQPGPPHGLNVGPTGNVNVTGVIGRSFVQVTPVGVGGIGSSNGSGVGSGGTMLFVGDLHWWTTDIELEAELVKYGPVKELKFFDEKASGKSKGYCQVEFYDPNAALACKDGLNGHLLNGKACVVDFASPFNVKRMGEAQVNRSQQGTQQNLSQTRRPNDFVSNNKPTGNNISTTGNYQGGDQNRNFGRGNWRGNSQGFRGPMGPMRNRPVGMSGGRGMMGDGGNGFRQGGMGPNPPLMHPQAMMGQGFDPGFGPMAHMGNYGGFPGGPAPPYHGMMSSFPPVGNVGMPGVAPHVNPAFFGRGMPMNGMGGMMSNGGIDGPNMGMWSDPNNGRWPNEEHGGRVGESSYGEEDVSDHHYGEAGYDRSAWQNPVKEKDKTSEKDFSGSSDKRYRDEREHGHDRDMLKVKDSGHDSNRERSRDDREVHDRGKPHDHDQEKARDRERSHDRDRERSHDRDRERSRDHGQERSRDRERDRDRRREDRDGHSDHHRYKDREADYDEEWDKGRSSRTHSKSRMANEQERSRSRDADYGKRRRVTSD